MYVQSDIFRVNMVVYWPCPSVLGKCYMWITGTLPALARCISHNPVIVLPLNAPIW